MADRVHPHDSPPSDLKTAPLSQHHQEEEEEEEVSTPRPSPPSPEKPVPPPGTYVIQIPKDQIYRVPPPENASRYQRLTRRKSQRSPCCCCLCYLLAVAVSLILLAGIAAAIFYLVFRPESPDYTIENIAIRGFNVTTSSSAISPEFDVTVRANNPNDKIGIYYEKKSSVNVFYEDVKLCEGVLPVFYQPSNNVTVFNTTLKGSEIVLTSAVNKSLLDAQNKGTVPFLVNLRAPVKIKVGSVKTWTITVKVDCDVTVDKLTAASKIVSNRCDYSVDLW